VATHGAYPEPGDLIGPYRVGERIGAGGMGVVHEALDTQLNRRVALKIISPHLAHDPEFRARFTREAQAQASLDSPYVVHVYAHGEVDGLLYIATQLVPDGDLGRMVQQRGAPSLPVAVDLIAQVASGLADAHAAGLVHRDIKPANVLLRISGDSVRAYLADFGIARQVTSDNQLTAAGSTVGTPSYMAPELHTGGRPGPASDVYSLGCLLWAAVSGRAPYSGTSDYQVVDAHLNAPVPQLAASGGLAGEVNRILRRAMAKNPADRYPHAGAMRDDLLTALRAPQVAPAPLPAGSGSGSRTAMVVVLVAVVVLGLIGLGVTYAVTRGGDDDPKADPTGSTGTSATDEPTDEPTDESSGPPTDDPTEKSPDVDYTPEDGDEQKATDVLTDALEGQEGIDAGTASCVAGKMVDELGVERMVEAGLLTPELEINEEPYADTLPSDVQSTLFSTAFDCALSNFTP